MVSLDFVPPIDPGFGDPGIPPVFGVFLGLFIVVFVVAVGFIVYVSIRKYRVIKKAGYDPLTVDAALAAKVLDSDMLRSSNAAGNAAPAASREERLAEVDALHARGVISDDERAAARAATLAG